MGLRHATGHHDALDFRRGAFFGPTWSPDGKYVVVSSAGEGIFQVRADGASQPQALTESKSLQYPTSFTPDGKRLAYLEFGGNAQIWTTPIEEQGGQLKAGKPEQFLKSSSNDILAEFSPDGRWLAYAHKQEHEVVFLMNFFDELRRRVPTSK